MNKKLLITFGIFIFGFSLFYAFKHTLFKNIEKDGVLAIVQKGDLSFQPRLKTEEHTNEKGEHRRDQPHLAARQNFEMTQDPKLGYPPVDRKLEAFKRIKQEWALKKDETSAIPGVQWKERGPDNVGGRTRAMIFDPNDNTAKKVWAGAIGGGLWYNDDITSAGSQWQNVDDMMDNLAISSITYDPSNTQVFYLGTGLGYTEDIRGEGIFKSTDGGTTWNHLNSTLNANFHYVQQVVVTESGTVLASTTTGVHRSIDGGQNWTSVISGRFGDLEIASDSTLYATEGVNSTGRIYKSTNDGVTWSNVTPTSSTGFFRVEIESAPSNPDVLYAVADRGSGETDIAWFKKSEDGGATWSDITIPRYFDQSCDPSTSHFTRGQAFFDMIIAVHPENENIVLAGGIDLHKSIDGGGEWGLISYWTGSLCDDYVHADQHQIIFRPGNPNEAIFGNDGGVSYSSDVGNASDPEFEDRNHGYNTALFYAAAARNEINSNIFLAGAQDNGTQRFTAPGVNSTVDVTGGDGGFCFIDQDDPNIQIASFVFNSYRLSTDGGLTFGSLSNDQDKGRFINPTDYDSDANILYGAGDVNELTRIRNISTTPTSLESINVGLGGRQITTIKVSPFTENRLFVGVRISSGEGRIFVIDSANISSPTIRDITGSYSGSHGGWVSSIDVGASDDQLLATFSNYGVSSVYETTDGGQNWIDKEDNLPDIPVRWGLYNPNNRNQVLLATELGVWSTNNLSADNPDWEPTNSGLASVRVDMLKYRAADEMVVAATYGRGLFTSDIFASTVDADFKTEQIVGYVGVPVHFEDASLLAAGSWAWDFGDGNTSAEQNPQYTYTTAGTYDISLSIANGTNTETKTGYVTILPVKPVPYSPADGGDFESNPDDFTSKALLNGVNHWQRGTPTNELTTTSSGTNVWKTDLDANITDEGFNYSSALYTPAFDLSDVTKDYTLKFRKSMENAFCNGPHGLQIQYTLDGGANWQTLGSSHDEYGAINWYNRGSNTGCSMEIEIFRDKTGWAGSVENEDTQHKLNFLAGHSNVAFRFVSAVAAGFNGGYNVDGFMIDDFEVEATDPTAAFEVDNTAGVIGQELQFLFRSVPASVTAFAWNFGDGNTSTDENPTHIYNAAGMYTVSLTITTTSGTDTETKTDHITILPRGEIPYTLEDGGNFETNTADFAAQNITGTPFELGSSSISGKDGTASGNNAWVTGLTEAQYQNDSEARLLTPSFEFNSVGDYSLEFKAKFSFEQDWDGFIVQYSTDLGETWEKLNPQRVTGWYNSTSDPNSVFGASVPIFSGNTGGQFETFSTDVSFLYSNNNVLFRFLFLSDPASVDAGVAIDDFQLLGPEPGPAVPEFSYTGNTGCSEQQVIFTNESTGSISSLSWDFGTNASPATATGAGPHTVTYTGSGSSTVTLTATSSVNGTVSEQKTDIISTNPIHTPSFTEENNGDRDVARLVASTGDAYQWYLNGIAIDGATEQVLLATERGNYSVGVTVGGCTVITDQMNVITAIADTPVFDDHISIYPNPFKDILTISTSGTISGKNMEVKIYDLSSKLLVTKTLIPHKEIEEIDLSLLSKGTYLIKLSTDDGEVTKKIIKE